MQEVIEGDKREQLEEIIRKMRAVREEEMGDKRSARSQSCSTKQRDITSTSRVKRDKPQERKEKNKPINPPPTPPTSSPSPSTPSSNQSRFWSEEKTRARHSASPSSLHPRPSRKLNHLTLPNNPDQARQLWERMKDEMWQHWETLHPAPEPHHHHHPLHHPQQQQRTSTAPHSRPSTSQPTVQPRRHLSTAVAGPLVIERRSVMELKDWSVRQLREELTRLGLGCEGCVEKQDLIDRIERGRKVEEEKEEEGRKERWTEGMLKEVDKWARHRSIVDLLNDLNTGTALHLTHRASVEEVSRVYKRTLLRVHPDKCDGDWQDKRRATEVFKVIHSKHREFVEQQGEAKR